MANEKEINQYLDSRGLRHSNKGYQYLLHLISIVLDNYGSDINMQELYNRTAIYYNTKSIYVERGIRYVIKNFNVSNKEFIYKAIDDIRFAMRPAS